MTKHASQLLDEPPILVYPSLAKTMGINKAIIFQQLHFLLNATKSAQTKNNFVDGRWWVYNSYPQWRNDYFPWLSIGAIKRLFLELEREGLVLSKQSVKSKADRRKWYAIDYARWEQIVTTMGTNCDYPPSAQIETMDGNKMRRSMVTKRANEIPETTTETTTEKKQKKKKAFPSKKKTTRKSTTPEKANGKESVRSAPDEPVVTSLDDIPNYRDEINEQLETLRTKMHTSRREYPKYVRRTQETS